MIKKNIIANLTGKFWSMFSSFVFIPLYIKYLGFESYSIISFTLVLVGLMAFFDGGLTATLSREFARSDNSISDKKNILNTIETSYLLVITIVIISIYGLSDFIAYSWLNLKEFDPYRTSFFIKIISFGIGFEMLLRLYIGGLLGLEYQMKANKFLIAWGIIRNGLVILIILYIPTLEVFFIWQTLSTIIFAIILKFVLNKSLLGVCGFFEFNFTIKKSVLKKIMKFAGGMFLISLIASINSQLDKVFISKFLSIETLGYYTLATSLAMLIFVVIGPVSIASLPRFTSMVSKSKNHEAELLFKKINTFISIFAFSVMANMCFFSEELIWIWTGDKYLALETSTYLPIIAVGFTMLSLQILPFNIAVANGHTKTNNLMGIISLFFTIPGYWISVKYFGAIGLATVFCVLMILQTLIFIYLIKFKFLKNLNLKTLYINQFILPLIISLIISFIFYSLSSNVVVNKLLTLIFIGFSLFTSLGLSMLIIIPKEELKRDVTKLLKDD